MPWDDIARSKFAADKSVPKQNADQLLERDELLATAPSQVNASEQSETSSSYLEQFAFDVRVPDFVQAGWFFYMRVERRVNAGSGGAVRLRNNTDANDGANEDTGFSNTAYGSNTGFSSELKVQVDSGPHSTVEIAVQSKNTDANTTFVRMGGSAQAITCWWEKT